MDALLDCLERNERAGIVYHREGIMGDYDDFDDLEKLIGFIRTGTRYTRLIAPCNRQNPGGRYEQEHL